MGRFLLGRIGKGVLTLFVSVTVTFLIIRLMPADPVSMMVDPKLGPEVQEAMRVAYGLDKTLLEQYLVFWQNLMHFDLGVSFRTQDPVTTVLMQKLPWTMLLLVMVVFLALIVGIPVGMFAAKHKGKFFDKVINIGVTIGISFFVPFLAFALLFVFSYLLKWLPTGGAYTPPPATGLAYGLDVIKHAILPAATLFIANVASIILYTRNSMLDVLNEDYIRTAYAKGLGERDVVRVHALKNAMIPTVTVTGIMVGSLVGGAVMTETIFAWPGIGRLIYDSVGAMDYPVLQGAFLVLAVTVVVMNIITDLVVAWLDPRIKLGGK